LLTFAEIRDSEIRDSEIRDEAILSASWWVKGRRLDMPSVPRSFRRDGLGPSDVRIAGLGAVSGYGWGRKLLWDGLYSAKPAAQLLPGLAPAFDDDLGWMAYVGDEGDPADGPSRFVRATRATAREAVSDALERGWRPGHTVGLIHGGVLGDVDLWRSYHHRHGLDTSRRGWLELMPSTVLTNIMKEFDFHGPAMAVNAMCATGPSGLLMAKMWIDAGLVTDVLVVVSDLSFSPENCRSFANLGPLVIDAPPLDSCRPFQEGSRGFCPGEASVAMVVTGQELPGWAAVRGGAMSHDAYHPVSVPADATHIKACLQAALDNSGTRPEEIAYLNAHGAGTAQGDFAEAGVFDEKLPDAVGLFSVKPLVGHCQGASGAIEMTASFFAFQSGVIAAPPRVAAGHHKLLDGPTACTEGPMVKSSLGMGGHTAFLVLDAVP